MLRFQLLLIATFLMCSNLLAQQGVFQGAEIDYPENESLERQFFDYKVYRIDAKAFNSYVKDHSERSERNLSLRLGNDYAWSVEISPYEIRGENFKSVIATEEGNRILPREETKLYRGHLANQPESRVTLTIDHNFIYGMVKKGNELFFIEPLRFFSGTADDLFIVYSAEDVKPNTHGTCAYDDMLHEAQQHQRENHEGHDDGEDLEGVSNRMGCKEVETAIAADFSMYVKYNSSVADVQNRIFGVYGNVQTNYDDEFNDQIIFLIVETFVSTCSTCDPWTSSTSAGTVLGSFTNWGPSGFSTRHDMGSFWTNRNFNGGTIGIAWLASICSSSRYHAIQDFSNNASLMRVLVAHEIGHNFSAGHDAGGSPFIMAPSVNTSNTWSNTSQNSINGFVPTRSCLQNCNIVQPPVADFVANPSDGCAPLIVNFTDISLNAPDTWQWSFPGGVPAVSTQQNPTVTYDFPGTYDVTLTVTNSAGNNTVTRTGLVVVDGPPIPSFTSNVILNGVTFNNTTINGTSYVWDFGDGVGVSSEVNPSYVYAQDGIYLVTLTATNDCGQATFQDFVVIETVPFGAFVADTLKGCDSLEVQFLDQSTSNVENWAWSLPGATPDTSNLQNPAVVYREPGVYTVTLVVSNGAGADQVVRTDYITVCESAVADFSFSVDSLTVFFTNNSTGINSVSWDFGDGNTSTSNDPVHTYAMGGDYEVTMIALGDTTCGPDTLIQTISLAVLPTAAFSADTLEGCVTHTVDFVDESSNADTWEWHFPGGTPQVSTDQFPIVEYDSAGVFDVTLIVGNSIGTDTLLIERYIMVDTVPTADFDFVIDTNNLLLVHFSDSSSFVDSLYWDFGDGTTSRDTNPDHTYAQDGIYTVQLIIENECGADTTEKEVTIVTLPNASFTVSSNAECAPADIQFTDESSTNTTSWEWSFPGGTPATSNQQNPSVNYAAAGVYDVRLIVSNAAGSDTMMMVGAITIDDIPVAGFTSSISGTDVTFINSSTNATSYSWDFGDGNSSTDANPMHTYAGDGTYSVLLTATNDCGSISFSQIVVITTAPSAAFSSSIQSGCSPLTVQFNDQSSSNTTGWSWSFPGGTPSTSTDQNPVVVYNTVGTYDVSLQVSNAAGSNLAEQLGYISVDDVPAVSFDSQVNGTDVTFTNSSTNATSYSWDFGDGNSSTDENPVYTYAGDGVYTVVLTATNNCGSVQTSQVVTITTLPSSGFSANTQTGCAPQTIQFTSQASANTTSWNWSFPGGTPSSSTDENPVVVYNAAGSYNVTLQVSNAAGSNEAQEVGYIVINDQPVAGFSASTSGTQASFTNSSTNATGYNWDFGDGNSSTDENPVHTYAGDGVYTVVLTVTNECGAVQTSQVVTIVTLPTSGFSANTQSGCAPQTIQFTSQASANTTGWSWSFPGGTPSTSTDENPVVVYNAAGTYNVTLQASNAAGSSEIQEVGYIVINDQPVAGFSASTNGTQADFTNSSTNATSYSWDFGDGNSSTDINPSHTYAGDGTYTVVLTATNECGSIQFTQTVTIVTAPSAGFSASVRSGCAPLTVQFNDLSSANTTGWSWSFPGGNPATSTDRNPVVEYGTAGSYTVTLVASNAAGDNEVQEVAYIVVNTIPTVGFSSQVSGTDVSFNNSTTNATSYSWDFGDGSSSTDANPSHTYAGDGTYTVVLTATNECGSVESSQIITIITPPSSGFSASIRSGCAPLTVQFNDESSANTTNWSWSFPGGTPANSTAQNPEVTYSLAGTYNVTLEVTNAAGSSETVQMSYIVVETVPTVDFSDAIFGSTVEFTNNSTNANSYVWDFGDGNSSTDVNPSHTYAGDGTYTVTLTATNDCGQTTTTQTVTIVTPPNAGFSADMNSGCAPFTVQFNDLSSSNTTGWSWSFPGGTPATSTDQNPVIIYNTPGVYDVTLIATTSAGSSTFSQPSFISVKTVPQPAFSSSTVGTTTDFTNTTSGAVSYSWDFGDGNSSTDVNPTHTYANDGQYTVVLTATNECGSVTTSEVITIVTAPTAGFSSDMTSGCAPLTVQFTDESSTNATSWEWTFNGGDPAVSNDQNPAVTYNTPGVYTVRLVASNSAGTDIAEQVAYIEVKDGPTAGFTTLVEDNKLTTTNASVNANSYLWLFGDGNSSTDANPIYNYSASGQYDVTLIATNECGSDTTIQTIVVTVVTQPVAEFTANITSGCAPLTVTFNDQSSANTTSWSWTFDGGDPATSTDRNPTVTYDTPGTYAVTLVAFNSAGSNSNTKVGLITVEAAPTAGFTRVVDNTTVEFTSNSSGADTYDWDFGDGNSSTDENPVHQYAMNGTYTVTLIVTNDCGTDTMTQLVEINDGLIPQAAVGASQTNGCAPFEVSFSDISGGNPTAWEWTFQGGDPATSTLQNPVVTYNAAGTYGVRMIAINQNGRDTVILQSFIVVEDVPVANFDFVTDNAEVTFDNNSTGGDTYLWDFGDGTTSNEEAPVHTYGSSGTFEVQLIVTNACGSDTTTTEVSIEITSITDPAFVAELKLFPNPNAGQFTLLMSGESRNELTIRFGNILGQEIFVEQLDFSVGQLTRDYDFSRLAAGTYIFRIQSGTEIAYRKVVINK